MYISGLQAKNAFALVKADAAAIISSLGTDLVFDELPTKIASRIYQQRKADIKDRESWPEIHDWLRGKAEQYAATFTGRVKALKLDAPELPSIDLE